MSSTDSDTQTTTSTQSNTSSDEQTTSQDTVKPKSNRGRKPLPEDQKKKHCRYLKCDGCGKVLEYYFGVQQYRRNRVVDKDLPKSEKTKIYNQRHKEKKALAKQNTCLLDG